MSTSRNTQFGSSWAEEGIMKNRKNFSCICQYWHTPHLSLLAVLIIAVVAIGSGCTSVVTMKMKDAFPDSGSQPPSGPAVTVLPVQESSATGRYATDLAYLGKGLSAYLALGPLYFPPVMMVFGEFHADTPRTDIVRMAVLSKLNHHGVPATYLAEGGAEGLKMLPKSSLVISVNLRTLDVETSELSMPNFIFGSLIGFNGISAHAVLDCRLWQKGQAPSPLWEGVGEGRYDSSEYDKNHEKYSKNYREQINVKNAFEKVWPSVVNEAVSLAIDQCITKSGLLEARTSGISKQ